MIIHLLKKSFFVYYSFMLILLSSCYAYGPTHETYTRGKITPPPPVKKKMADPVSKSEYMQKTYNDIKNTLSEADVIMIEDSIKVLFPNNIVYEKSSDTPTSNYQNPLIKFAVLLKKYFKTEILITGHTDSHGNKDKNRKISSARAKNILTFISSHGVAENRLQALGLGDLSPIASNDTDEGRAKNRRVEFVVLYKE